MYAPPHPGPGGNYITICDEPILAYVGNERKASQGPCAIMWRKVLLLRGLCETMVRNGSGYKKLVSMPIY